MRGSEAAAAAADATDADGRDDGGKDGERLRRRGSQILNSCRSRLLYEMFGQRGLDFARGARTRAVGIQSD